MIDAGGISPASQNTLSFQHYETLSGVFPSKNPNTTANMTQENLRCLISFINPSVYSNVLPNINMGIGN